MDDLDKYFVLESPLLKLMLLNGGKAEHVNQIFASSDENGEFQTLFQDLLDQPEKFAEYFRMTPATFEYLLNGIEEAIKKLSNFRECISPTQRLAVTLRWFDCSDKLSYYMNLVVTRMYLGNDKEGNLQEANHIKKIVGYFMEELILVFNSSSWMDAQTLQAAIKKVNELKVLVGFSEKLTEDIMIEAIYLHFPEMSETNHYENMVKVKTYYSLSSLCCLEDELSDREKWLVVFLEANAVYSMSQNSIQIPLGILQAPFYRKDAALPVFFGSTGTIIGHEIFHGFDKTGSTRNWNGTLTTWWTNQTKDEYNKGMECYEDLYSSLPLLEEIRDQEGNLVKVDGGRTVEENSADNEGISLSWNVYKKLQGNVDQTLIGLENYSSDQLFFISFAQMWCSNFEHERLVEALKYDYHTPEPFRVRGLVRNNPHFAQVFNCSAQAPMTSPEKCAVW